MAALAPGSEEEAIVVAFHGSLNLPEGISRTKE